MTNIKVTGILVLHDKKKKNGEKISPIFDTL